MKKKSILFLCQFFYPEKVSSAVLPFDTAKSFADLGFEVNVVCGYPKDYLLDDRTIPVSECVDGVNITRIKYKSFNRKHFFGRLLNYFSFTFKCLLKSRIAKDYEYVFVYSNPPVLPYVAYKMHKRYGTKIVFVSYDVYPEIAIESGALKKNSLISRVMDRINKKVFKNVHKVVSLSEDMKDFFVSKRSVDPSKIEVIPNWFSVNGFEPGKKERPAQKDDCFKVSYFGNLGICQDVETLLGAARELREENVKFTIGGRGCKLETVKNYVRENGLENVTVMPFLDGVEYFDAMNSSDCFIVSLIKGISSLCFPSKYYSYLYFGKPIIAVMDECEITKEIEVNSFGFSVRNYDIVSLVKAIRKLKSLNEKDYSLVCESISLYYESNYRKEIAMKKYLTVVE